MRKLLAVPPAQSAAQKIFLIKQAALLSVYCIYPQHLYQTITEPEPEPRSGPGPEPGPEPLHWRSKGFCCAEIEMTKKLIIKTQNSFTENSRASSDLCAPDQTNLDQTRPT